MQTSKSELNAAMQNSRHFDVLCSGNTPIITDSVDSNGFLNAEDIELTDFTIELDGFVSELTEVKEEPAIEQVERNENGRFECPFNDNCAYTTKHRSHINIHIRRHTGEKPFSCQHCERRFCKKQNLQRHQLTHPEFGGVNCKFCHVRFKPTAIKSHTEKCKRKERPPKQKRT